jgi:hypothetical protein
MSVKPETYEEKLARARECFASFARADRVCGGCKAFSHCGMGDRLGRAKDNFLRAVDPTGQNITVIGIGPLGKAS